MKIEILDLGINNLNSVIRVFQNSVGSNDQIDITISKSSSQEDAQLLVLPGLGSFSAGMAAIRSRGFEELILDHIARGGKIAAICLGMQLLGNSSEESENVSGLNIIPGETHKLKEQKGERVPNVGWLETKRNKNISNFESLTLNQDFYFVHSYEFLPKNPNEILCTSLYGRHEFVSGLISDNVCAFQFHPEKSAKVGRALIKEIVDWSNGEI